MQCILGKFSQKNAEKCGDLPNLPRPPPWFGVFTNKKLTHHFFLENEPLMRETNFTLGPI